MMHAAEPFAAGARAEQFPYAAAGNGLLMGRFTGRY